MKLLIITQKVGREDDIFGFFHSWIEKLAAKFETINTICLELGQYSLPSNVKVWSLGKEKGKSKLEQVSCFYKYIWNLRKDYDLVFVHMNSIYIVLAGAFWKFAKKKLFLWCNHRYAGPTARLGTKLADAVFYTSPFAFSASLKNSKIMPVGINTKVFRRNDNIKKEKNSILCLGRISAVKKIDVLIKTANYLDKEGRDFNLDIVGKPEKGDENYFRKIKNLSKSLEAKGKIKFLGNIPNYKTQEIYNRAEVYVNLTPSGSFDKTIIEAIACETIPMVCNESLRDILPDFLIFKEGDAEDLKEKIVNVLNIPTEEKETLAQRIRVLAVQKHGLDALIKEIIQEFKNY